MACCQQMWDLLNNSLICNTCIWCLHTAPLLTSSTADCQYFLHVRKEQTFSAIWVTRNSVAFLLKPSGTQALIILYNSKQQNITDWSVSTIVSNKTSLTEGFVKLKSGIWRILFLELMVYIYKSKKLQNSLNIQFHVNSSDRNEYLQNE